MKEKELWEEFIKESNLKDLEYDSYVFGCDADRLASLVLEGKKRATSSLYILYELENEALPKENEYSVILDSKGDAVCIVKVIKVLIIPFNKVTALHAYKEGEGDMSLSYWKEIHRNYFTKVLKEFKLEFNDTMKIVFEEFEVVYKPKLNN